MIFTVLRRWTVHIHVEDFRRPGHDAVAGAVVIHRDEYRSENFQQLLSAKVFNMKDSMMRHAAAKWSRPPGL